MSRGYRHIKEYEAEILKLKQPREKKKSLQSCNSTVTKAFNTHHPHILSSLNLTVFGLSEYYWVG